MYYNDRIIIDTRKYEIDVVYERYKNNKILFPEKRQCSLLQKNKIVQEVLEALIKGIPFPPIYASELQTGNLLILDSGDRLRYLMQFLDNEFEMPVGGLNSVGLRENTFFSDVLNQIPWHARDILYSPLTFHVIDYMNPKYRHMQVGSFVEEWSIVQEQSVRNILYQGAELNKINEVLDKLSDKKYLKLVAQFEFIYFIMFYMVTLGKFEKPSVDISGADRYQLLEIVIEQVKYTNMIFLEKVCNQYNNVRILYDKILHMNCVAFSQKFQLRYKYLCFLSWFMERGENNVIQLLKSGRNRRWIENCDMGYASINKTMEVLGREIL